MKGHEGAALKRSPASVTDLDRELPRVRAGLYEWYTAVLEGVKEEIDSGKLLKQLRESGKSQGGYIIGQEGHTTEIQEGDDGMRPPLPGEGVFKRIYPPDSIWWEGEDGISLGLFMDGENNAKSIYVSEKTCERIKRTFYEIPACAGTATASLAEHELRQLQAEGDIPNVAQATESLRTHASRQ